MHIKYENGIKYLMCESQCLNLFYCNLLNDDEISVSYEEHE
jgi:hypothetical protein